ncbi:S-adenosylmethionine uptake transporter [Devosia enhydra]|uniref:S-adenosylmethionine uptake transporter n=1 Tax=Devosia enhydra TaxID=665118 RepID=A0A1K2HUH7_9HYPH|nr:DMT family transporter [Devosia enhydra]SFZ82079.1 S-adenosylmethionine uptake transporter [Devosia enhydra]
MSAKPTVRPAAAAPRALGLAALGMAAFTLLDVVVKALAPTIPTAELVFFRFGGTGVILGIYILAFRKAWPRRELLWRHAARAVLVGLTAMSFFYALSGLPLALTTALAMTGPVYVGVLSAIFLRETITGAVMTAVAMALVGSVVIVLGNSEAGLGGTTSWLAWAAAFAAPLFYAGGIVLLKVQASDEPATAITFAQAMMVAAAALPATMATGFVMPQGVEWLMVVALGVLGTAGYLLFVVALKMIPASLFALVDYTALLWAAMFGYVFFGEVPGLTLWIGGAIIIAACVVGLRGARG